MADTFSAFSSRLGYEEHIPGQTRDWNEELQTTRELPRKNLPERLIRERAIFKVYDYQTCRKQSGSNYSYHDCIKYMQIIHTKGTKCFDFVQFSYEPFRFSLC